MTGSPRVTVVVITRDRRDQLLDALQHADATQPLVVVDNGSTDGTPEAVEQHHPHAVVLRAGRNLGAAGRTLGVRAATTPYVAFSDDDSWWAPGALEQAAQHLDAAPRLGLLAARVLVGEQGRLDPTCAVMARSPLPAQPDLPGVPVLGFVACGSVVRRRAYLQVGGFHPLLGFLGEESLLAQDLAHSGWGVSYVEDVVAHHHPKAGPERTGRRRQQLRNDLLTSWLRRPLPASLRHTAALLRRVGEPAARGALADAVVRLPAVAWARQPLRPDVEAQVRLLETAGG